MGDGERITHDKKEIEEEIMKANEKKLMQASDTILRSARYQELLGEQGNFEKWEQILRKEISVPPDAEPELKMWFQAMTSYENVEQEFQLE